MSDEDAYQVTVELTRGTSTDDRDKIRAKVSAATIDGLEEKVAAIRDRVESWAGELREVQPETPKRWEHPDQQTLEMEEGEA